MELTISRREDDQAGTVLVLVGSIDMVSRDGLLEEGRRLLDEGGSLRLDLAGVDFMDSTGIGALVELSKVAAHLNRTFDIVAMSARVRRVLEVTGLQDAWQLA